MTDQKRYELLTHGELEYVDIELKDGSSLRTIFDGYRQEGDEIVFSSLCAGSPPFELETFRIKAGSLADDWTHWLWDSYDEYPAIIQSILETKKLSDKSCWYCKEMDTIHGFFKGKIGKTGTATFWCSFCWKQHTEKVIVPSWWVTIKRGTLPKFPDTPGKLGNFQEIVDLHWKTEIGER